MIAQSSVFILCLLPHPDAYCHPSHACAHMPSTIQATMLGTQAIDQPLCRHMHAATSPCVATTHATTTSRSPCHHAPMPPCQVREQWLEEIYKATHLKQVAQDEVSSASDMMKMREFCKRDAGGGSIEAVRTLQPGSSRAIGLEHGAMMPVQYGDVAWCNDANAIR